MEGFRVGVGSEAQEGANNGVPGMERVPPNPVVSMVGVSMLQRMSYPGRWKGAFQACPGWMGSPSCAPKCGHSLKPPSVETARCGWNEAQGYGAGGEFR